MTLIDYIDVSSDEKTVQQGHIATQRGATLLDVSYMEP
jgi:hypothetical protein